MLLTFPPHRNGHANCILNTVIHHTPATWLPAHIISNLQVNLFFCARTSIAHLAFLPLLLFSAISLSLPPPLKPLSPPNSNHKSKHKCQINDHHLINEHHCFSASLPLRCLVLCFIPMLEQQSPSEKPSFAFIKLIVGMLSHCLCSTLVNKHQCFSSINRHGQFLN